MRRLHANHFSDVSLSMILLVIKSTTGRRLEEQSTIIDMLSGFFGQLKTFLNANSSSIFVSRPIHQLPVTFPPGVDKLLNESLDHSRNKVVPWKVGMVNLVSESTGTAPTKDFA